MPLDLTKYNVKPVESAPQGSLDLSKYGVSSVSPSYSPEPAKPESSVKGGFVGELFSGNTQRFGKTIGESLAAPKNAQLYSDAVIEHTNAQNYLIKAINTKKKMGQDISRLEVALAHHIDNTPKLEDFTGDVINKSTKQILGEAGGTALEALSGGLLGGEAKALGSKALSTAQKIAQGATIGAGYGAAGGLTTAMQEDKDAAGIIGSTLKGGALGGVLGGGLGAAGAALSKRAAGAAERAADKIEKAAGQVLQGSADDVVKGIKVLSNLDTRGVKTYEELGSKLDDKITGLSKAQDKFLDADKATRLLDTLEATVKVGKENIRHNFVRDAIDQLTNYYEKTNNIVGKAKMKELLLRAEQKGLTTKEINDLAKLHGRDLNAFNANGELASGLTKQAAENTRSGVKTTVRQLSGGKGGSKASEAIDREISDNIKVRDLVSDMEQKVNIFQQKLKDRGLLYTVGRGIGKAFDLFSGRSLSGFVQALTTPVGQGNFMMNSGDIQRALEKNLKIIQGAEKILDSGAPKESLLDQLQKFLNQEINLSNQSSKGGNMKIASLRSPVNTQMLAKKSSIKPISKSIPLPKKPAKLGVNIIPKEVESLAIEAKKYKTATAFIKAQGTPVYHGSPASSIIEKEGFKKKQGNLVNAFGDGTYLSTNKRSASAYRGDETKGGGVVEAYLPKNVKLKVLTDRDAYSVDTKKLIEQGFDGVKIPYGNNEHNITIFDPSIIKTKSQLTDLFNRVKNNKGSTTIGTMLAGGVATLPFVGSKETYVAPVKPPILSPKVDVDKLAKTIKTLETQGEKEPYAFRRFSGSKALGDALGAYQITENELKTYGKRFLGKNVSRKEFLSNPKLQDDYMKGKINSLMERGLSLEEILASHRRGMSDLTEKGLADRLQKASRYVKKGLEFYKE